MIDKLKEFKPSSWCIDNKTSIYVLTIIITLGGILSYQSLPKEQFPDIVIPTIFVTTFYNGTSPLDMENLVTKQLEKQLKSISGVNKMTSNSLQDFSNVVVEFRTDIPVAIAKQKVKDAIDKAQRDLPNDLTSGPTAIEVDFSEFPMMQVNVSGAFSLDALEGYSDDLKDKIEGLKEITRVDMGGALEREMQINVDMFKAQAAQLSIGDIARALQFENMTITGGLAEMNGMKRTLQINGEFKTAEQIKEITINTINGAPIYLKDIAEVKFAAKEAESYARLNGKNVITLNVIRKTGENLIDASDKIHAVIDEMKKDKFPKNLEIVVTGDQSTNTRITLHDLINTIIIGFILVTLVLMFFMGATNALFVAMSVPLSMFIAFLLLPSLGFTLNMIVLFSFLLALGIVVDDAIVVIENTHRIFDNGKVPIKQAAKMATGEVFLPVLSGTLTTLAPFIPLAFWQGIIGKFMYFLPVTMIVSLLASLFVAYVINPVFAVQFMKPHKEEDANAPRKPFAGKSFKTTAIILSSVAVLSYIYGLSKHVSGAIGIGNFAVTLLLFYIFYRLVLKGWIKTFQTKTWPAFQNRYEHVLKWALHKPALMLISTVLLFIFSIVLLGLRKPNVVFFPQSEPNFVYTYISLPTGTSTAYTDSVTRIVEARIMKVLGPDNKDVSSVISNVAVSAGDPRENDRATYSHRAKVTVAFVEFAKRINTHTSVYIDEIRKAVKGIPGAEIAVDREQGGPPTSKPIQVEISGDDFGQLSIVSNDIQRYLDSVQVPGVEELRTNLQDKKPQITFSIDRERANREGISTAQIGMELRSAVYGTEATKVKDGNEDYPVMVRYMPEQRNNIDALNNAKITYRDMAMGGMVRQVPISSFTTVKYTNTYDGIARKNQKRTVTLSSNVLTDYNPNETVAKVEAALKNYSIPVGITVIMGGELEQQKETMSFLGNALMISLLLILLILVTQFNSVSKPLIILTEIIFSMIGVFLGVAIFGMDFVIVMTGIGIVALAGIVVRNGILIVEFTDLLREQGMPLFEAIVEGGKTRLTPVLLTATATILGLVPLAIGLNIDFVTLFTDFNPHFFLGGDSVAFWGPLAWTMIFGLSFATLITLIVVPVMYLITERIKLKMKNKKAPAAEML